MLSPLLVAVCLLSQAQSQALANSPTKQWWPSSTSPGWAAYGAMRPDGWVESERYRRIDDPSVVVPVVPVVAPSIPSGDPYGFIGWLNSTRATYGLAVVSYDSSLESWGHQNNAAQSVRGLGHHIMGPARRQNAAGPMGFPAVAYAWMGSPGHAAALLDPTIRWVSIAYSAGYWTFSAY